MSSQLQLTAHAQVLLRQHFAGPQINLTTAKSHSNELPSQAATWAAIFSAAAPRPLGHAIFSVRWGSADIPSSQWGRTQGVHRPGQHCFRRTQIRKVPRLGAWP
jgi:hypothetical protein